MMNSVWFACPSARPVEEVNAVLRKWTGRGYNTALWRDVETTPRCAADVVIYPVQDAPVYPGYARACNELVQFILQHDSTAQWIVCAGDDTEPDPNKWAEEIAAECESHFATQTFSTGNIKYDWDPTTGQVVSLRSTFGVMQPTGDRWGDNQPPLKGAYIDRICGSSWYGREFCKRINGGRGLFHPEYHHMYVDEEMFEVAKKLGVLWQRRDLTQYHNHWGRKRGATEDMPAFLAQANSPQHWAEAKAIFERRKAAGFPGHEPI